MTRSCLASEAQNMTAMGAATRWLLRVSHRNLSIQMYAQAEGRGVVMASFQSMVWPGALRSTWNLYNPAAFRDSPAAHCGCDSPSVES